MKPKHGSADVYLVLWDSLQVPVHDIWMPAFELLWWYGTGHRSNQTGREKAWYQLRVIFKRMAHHRNSLFCWSNHGSFFWEIPTYSENRSIDAWPFIGIGHSKPCELDLNEKNWQKKADWRSTFVNVRRSRSIFSVTRICTRFRLFRKSVSAA